MKQTTITILCSGASLGVYVPGLVTNKQLRNKGLNTEIVVLENLLFEEKKNNVHKSKLMFHQNFSFALMAQKLAKDITPSLDPILVKNLLEKWQKEERKDFIVFSGFWLPIIDKYLSQIEFKDIRIDLCHMDAAISTSWKLYDTSNPRFRNIWFFRREEKKIFYNFPISHAEIIPDNQRNHRFLIHGGGCGVGTYKSKILDLEQQEIELDVIVYENKDLEHKTTKNRYFMIDPQWKAWDKDEMGNYQFPPLGWIKENAKIVFRNNESHPEVYNLIQHNKAIISKPGGATLIDSLSAATPLIWLDPYGEYEESNGLLWEELGFGISYQKWVDSGYSLDLLENLHNNIQKATVNLPNYFEIYN